MIELIKCSNISAKTGTIHKSIYPFHLMIKPIGPKCNLKCDYCFYLEKDKYYPPNHTYRMSDGILERLTQQYINAQPSGTSEVNFAWQGGEPSLMGLSFFKRAVAMQKKHMRPGMHISNSFQTNGTLIDEEWAQFFKENNFLVGISVDGPMKIHDRFRKTKSGKGSFRLIQQAIKVLRKFEVQHNFLCVINRQNGDHPNKVYQALKKLGAKHIQFIPIVEHNYFDENNRDQKRGKNSYSCTTKTSSISVEPKQFGEFLNNIFDEWVDKDFGNIFIQNFESVLNQVMGKPSPVCIHAVQCGRNLTVEHDGSIYSCDHFVYPSFKLGNLTKSPIAQLVDSPQQRRFGTDKQDQLCNDCKLCPYIALCQGGCPAHRISPTKRDTGKQNYLCEGYKIFFKNSHNKFTQIINRDSTPNNIKNLKNNLLPLTLAKNN